MYQGQTDNYTKSRTSYYAPIKRLKDQNNCKLKIADTKRKLHNLISHLQSLDIESNRNEIPQPKSVKEIANYFENMSKLSQSEKNNAKLKESFDNWNNNMYQNKNLTPFPNSLPFHNSGNMSPKNVNLGSAINLHSVWRNTVLNGGNAYCKNIPYPRSDATLTSGIKTSLRTSLVTCVMMLQYIIWWELEQDGLKGLVGFLCW